MPAASQRPIISRCLPRQVDTACLEHFQFEKLAPDILDGSPVAHALENLAENHIRKPKTLSVELPVEYESKIGGRACKVLAKRSRADDTEAGGVTGSN
jgi:hypothetical protein